MLPKRWSLAEPELSNRAQLYTNAVVVQVTGSTLKVVSAEAYTKHGVNAHGVIIDELPAQPDRELVGCADEKPLIPPAAPSPYPSSPSAKRSSH